MTHNEKLDFVINKIHEAVPSIKELTLGCEISRKGASREWFVGRFAGEMALVKAVNGSYFLPFTIPEPPESQDYEIIGRKIGIADVLLTIKKRVTQDDFIQESSMEELQEIIYHLISTWDLKNDDITKQSEETVDFLYNLLK